MQRDLHTSYNEKIYENISESSPGIKKGIGRRAERIQTKYKCIGTYFLKKNQKVTEHNEIALMYIKTQRKSLIEPVEIKYKFWKKTNKFTFGGVTSQQVEKYKYGSVIEKNGSI